MNVTDAKNNSFVGHIKSGKRSGQGTMKYGNGDRYQGLWENDLKEGEGSKLFSKCIFVNSLSIVLLF